MKKRYSIDFYKATTRPVRRPSRVIIIKSRTEPIMVRYCVLAVAMLCITAAAFAHGNSQHVLGTVTAIDAKHIEVKTSKGAIVSIGLTKQTRFREKNRPKSTLAPAVGDR